MVSLHTEYRKQVNGTAVKSNTPKVKGSSVTDRLTDSNKYTGAHKERFDASGKGKGIEGRETRSKNDGFVGNYKGDGKYEKTKNTSGAAKVDDITKRMTDTSLYTGAHGKRFDDSGKGKGKSGRVDEQEHTGYTAQYKGKGTAK